MKLKNILSVVLTLFVCTLIIDPADVIFRLKIPLFALTLLLCLKLYPRVTISFLSINVWLYVILFLTSSIGFIFSYNVDNEVMIFFYKTLLMTLLLPWISHLDLLNRFSIHCMIVACVVIFIYVVMQLFPQLEIAIYAFVQTKYDGTIMMGRRTFVGIDFISVYYTSAPVFILLLPIYFSRLLYRKSRGIKDIMIFILLFLTLMMGATRAMMLSAIGVLVILYLKKMSGTEYGKYWALLLGLLGVVISICALNLLWNDLDESSNVAKHGFLDAFFDLIRNNPSILLWGQGVGATFDLGGDRGIAALSEWTYLELVRWFGIPLAVVVVVIYVWPWVVLYKKRTLLEYSYPLRIGYMFYLLIAATNPYLFGSNGILALLTMYSYAYNPRYESSCKMRCCL